MVVTIRTAATTADFATIHRMQADMAVWDAAQCEAAGCSGAGVSAAFYSDTVAQLQASFTATDALMLIAVERGEVLGHAGFARYDAGRAELTKVWLTPAARGQGTAWRMLVDLRAAMLEAGYRGAVLETTTFMAAAVRAYLRLGFHVCPPFRAPPAGLAPITIFMRAEF